MRLLVSSLISSVALVCAGAPVAAAGSGETASVLISPTAPASSDTVAVQQRRELEAQIDGRWIVTFPDAETARRAAAGQPGTVAVLENLAVVIVQLPGLSEQQVLTALPGAMLAEPDRVVEAQGSQQQPPWGLDRIDQRDVPLSNSYGWTGDGAGVTAYIIDSGIRSDHPEFAGRLRMGKDFLNPGNTGGEDCQGHGTHVAGTVGGSTYGIAKRVQLVNLRVMNCSGSSIADSVFTALDWVIGDHQAGTPAVANLSLGGTRSESANEAVAKAVADGVVVVVAAMNDGRDACQGSPASAPAAITVAASDRFDQLASFSNHGPCVDLIAPGVAVPSASHQDLTKSVLLSGTSMAAPHVAGAAAVLLSKEPALTPAAVAERLIAVATRDRVRSSGSRPLPDGTPNLLLYQAGAASQPHTPPPAPPVSIQEPQQGAVVGPDLTVRFTVTGTRSHDYCDLRRLDEPRSVQISRCTSPATFRGLDPGAWVLQVGSTLEDGSPGPFATVDVTVDATVVPAPAAAIARLAGADRLATSIAISQDTWASQQAQSVVLARWDAFPDALAGTPLAVANDAPLLLTPSGGLSTTIAGEIKRVLPVGRTVYLLGGTTALSPAVADAVGRLGYRVVRLGGADRYATAVTISTHLGTPAVIFQATGLSFQNALISGVAAAGTGGVVVLTADGQMPDPTRAYLERHPRVERVAVGPQPAADPSATKITGTDVYDTARLLAERYFSSPRNAAVASGTVFADALAGGAHIGRLGGPLLLSEPTRLPAPVANYLSANRDSIDNTTIYGGSGALSTSVQETVKGHLRH
jgi:hypothetical protein